MPYVRCTKCEHAWHDDGDQPWTCPECDSKKVEQVGGELVDLVTEALRPLCF